LFLGGSGRQPIRISASAKGPTFSSDPDQRILASAGGAGIGMDRTLEDAIDQALLLLKACQDLGQDRIIVHRRPSACDSAVSASGSQKVISMVLYNSMAVDSSVRARSRRPIVAYTVPKPR
jgi:hypothetical protein